MADEYEPQQSFFTCLPLLVCYAVILMFGGCVGGNIGYTTATTISPDLRRCSLLYGGDGIVGLSVFVAACMVGGGYAASRLASTVGFAARRKKLRRTDDVPRKFDRHPRQPSDRIESDDNRRRIDGG